MTTQKPILYHPGVEETIDCLAAESGYGVTKLRLLSEQAIQFRHDQATKLYEARGRQPDIWELDLGKVSVVYTVEVHAVVIRGYHWNIPGEPLDDFDGGGYFCEHHWH